MTKFSGKAIIVSAPSGAGKTTLVHRLLDSGLPLGFSVSVTSREKRPNEKDGVDYYFVTPREFSEKIRRGEFIEWEEVYPRQFYGTLKSEIERLWNSQRHVLFDVDVKGGLNLKKYFAARSLAVFIQPPSLQVLKERLIARGTETEAGLNKRLARAEYEMSFASGFDAVIVNDILGRAAEELYQRVKSFIYQS